MDSKDKLAEEINQLSPEDLKEVAEEPGDINDIIQEIPNKEKLDQLKALLDGMPREKVTELLANLMQNNGVNPINPNDNTYTSSSKNDMLKYKLRQKINQQKANRMTHKAKELEKEKQDKIMQEKMKTNPSESHEHACQNGCKHDH